MFLNLSGIFFNILYIIYYLYKKVESNHACFVARTNLWKLKTLNRTRKQGISHAIFEALYIFLYGPISVLLHQKNNFYNFRDLEN